jgi:small subunit ribosomal protein S18
MRANPPSPAPEKAASDEPRAYFRKRRNPLQAAGIEKVTFKDVNLLKYFVTERGRIMPRRMTGLTSQQQRMIARAVKQARMLALLPTKPVL